MATINNKYIKNSVKLANINGINKIVSSGYLSYNNLFILGFMQELIDNNAVLNNNLKDFLATLMPDKTYSILFVIRWSDHNGISKGVTAGNAIKVTNNTNLNILAKKITFEMVKNLMKYGISELDCEVVIVSRVWYELSDFKVTKNELDQVLNEVILDSLGYDANAKNVILKRISVGLLNDYSNVTMNNYGINIRDNLYKFNDKEYLEVIIALNGGTIVNVKDLANIENNDTNDIIVSWLDVENSDGFVRNIGGLKYFYINKKLDHIEVEYKFPNIQSPALELEYNEKIGTIDLETFANEGYGDQNVYACAWHIQGIYKDFYIDLKGEKYSEDKSEELIRLMIQSIFNEKTDKYTFYVHNLGRFDSLFLIKALVSDENYKIRPIWKDNSIISIKIKDIQKNKSIKIYDSMNIIPSNLNQILIDFKCNIKKDIFPYTFMNENTLYYVGDIPDYSFYNSKYVSFERYNRLWVESWDAKDETLRYLRADVSGLLEVMNLFNSRIFEKFDINVTSYPTISGLAMAIYNTQVSENAPDIKIIKGMV